MGMAGSARPAATHPGPAPAGQPLSHRHGVTGSHAQPQRGNVDSPLGDSSGVQEFSPSVLPPPLHPLRGPVRSSAGSLRLQAASPSLARGCASARESQTSLCPANAQLPLAALRSAPLLLPAAPQGTPGPLLPPRHGRSCGSRSAPAAARSRGQVQGPGAAGRGGRGSAPTAAASPSPGPSARPPGRSVPGVGLSGTAR